MNKISKTKLYSREPYANHTLCGFNVSVLSKVIKHTSQKVNKNRGDTDVKELQLTDQMNIERSYHPEKNTFISILDGNLSDENIHSTMLQ